MSVTSERPTTRVDAWTSTMPWIDRDDADIDGYVRSVKRPPSYDLAERLRFWRDNGYVLFEGVVAHEQIDRMLEDVVHFQKHFGEYRIPVEVFGKPLESADLDAFPADSPGIKINEIHCFSKAAAKLSLTAEVVDFLGHVFGETPVQTQSLTFWRGSQQPVHIDHAYVRRRTKLAHLAASWIPLEDVHPDSGPLGYYPGGHKIEASGFFDWGDGSVVLDDNSTRTPNDFALYLRERMAARGIARVETLAKKGDVFIWHANLPHEGTPVNNPALTRKSYVSHFTSLSAVSPDLDTHEAMRRGRGVFENGGVSARLPWLEGRPYLPSGSDH